jgi:hypothetical protein
MNYEILSNMRLESNVWKNCFEEKVFLQKKYEMKRLTYSQTCLEYQQIEKHSNIYNSDDAI